MTRRVALLLLGTALAATAASAQGPSDGKKIFGATCAACHQATGEGVPEKYPPLAGSEWVTGDEGRLVRVILHGLTGDVEVQGETFNGAMPAWGPTLSDPDIAAVATYIRASFGNKAAPVSTATVTQIRAATKARTTPWTVQELAQVLQVKK